MRITIFGAGSQGDIQPCLRLGNRLQQSGLEALVALPQNFTGQARAAGLTCYPLRGDVQQIMAGETGQKYMTSGGNNPIQSILAMRKMLKPVALDMAEDVLSACRQADALITLAVFAPFGKTIAEICGIPLILIEPTPVLPTGDFPAPGWLIQRDWGRLMNRFSGFAMLEVIWQWYRPFINEFRKRFGLRPLNGTDFYQTLSSAPLLGAYSPNVIPHPKDWTDNAHITGYWFDAAQTGWQPSVELAAFLEQGEPPVYVGFGSMAGRSPAFFAEIVLEALQKTNRRGILATGWGGMHVADVPKEIFVLDSAPHGWLFPRMSVVVHHGGAGTTAESLRAGIPAVIVPFIADQLFWGKRVQALGAGVEPVAAKHLTVNRLAEAIQKAASDPAIRQRAAALGKAIQVEDGPGNAAKIIRQYLRA